jgi:hypothetical protein
VRAYFEGDVACWLDELFGLCESEVVVGESCAGGGLGREDGGGGGEGVTEVKEMKEGEGEEEFRRFKKKREVKRQKRIKRLAKFSRYKVMNWEIWDNLFEKDYA